ncbi:MAG TPA: hypothetical protein VFB34_13835 [Chloroflexota bacterium]|nr:hypothetical protein [Chloroflexota bacterium]
MIPSVTNTLPAGRRRINAVASVALALTVAAIPLLLGATAFAAGQPYPKTAAASPMTSISYALVKDVGGPSVAKGDTITLTFAPAAKLYLLATSPQGDLSYSGSWSLSGTKLTLTFNDSGFVRHATFAVNLAAAQIQIPFQVFSGNKGSSIWNRTSIDPISGAYRIAQATGALTGNGATLPQIVAAAGKYVAGVTGATLTAGPSMSGAAARGPADRQGSHRARHLPALKHFGTRLLQRNANPGARQSGSIRPAALDVSSVTELENELVLTVERTQHVAVILDSMDQAGGSAMPLTPGPLAGDPRVHLHAKPPGINTDDPKNKTALFFDPFESTRYIGWQVFGTDLLPAVRALSDSATTAKEVSILKSDGYTTEELVDTAATVPALIGALHSSPGVVMITTHGGADGSLATGQYLGSSSAQALAALGTIQDNLAKTYGLPKDAIWGGSVPTLGGPRYFVLLEPKFWTWLESSKGVNLSHSLVYVGACYTDRTPALRQAIRARAYFAFHEEGYGGLVNAVGSYLVQMLDRPTVSPEEVYYNMIRVDQSSQEIYAEDTVFKDELYPQTVFFNDRDIQTAIVGVVDAYGTSGQVIPYLYDGWLNKKVDQGQVWWLTFASRWGQDTKQGVKNLELCWNTYWSKGQLGGLKSPFCQNANDGSVPSKNDVNYAIYLVSGDNMGFGFTVVPRFTLNDGRT